jgi:opacity protein-like surface antigen
MKKLLFLAAGLLICSSGEQIAHADQPVFGCAPSYGHTGTAGNLVVSSGTTSAFVARTTSSVLAYYSALNYSASTSLTLLIIDGNQPIAGNGTLNFCQYGNSQTPVNGCIAAMSAIPAANAGSVGQIQQSWNPGPYPKFNYGLQFVCSSEPSANVTFSNNCGFSVLSN